MDTLPLNIADFLILLFEVTLHIEFFLKSEEGDLLKGRVSEFLTDLRGLLVARDVWIEEEVKQPTDCFAFQKVMSRLLTQVREVGEHLIKLSGQLLAPEVVR